MGNKDEPATLDPHLNTASSTGVILTSLFEGLVVLAGDGKTILPGAAASWEISSDGLTYTFHLRPNLRWSNGDPLTATDFRDSILRLISPKLGSDAASLAMTIVGARDFSEGRSTDPSLVGLRAEDPKTFVMTLTHPAPYWLCMIAGGPFFPVHRPSVEAGGSWDNRAGTWTRQGKLVSNGPFVLAEWRPNAFVRVARNEHYWAVERVRLREVRFYPTEDENSEERSFRAGQLHVTARFPRSKLTNDEGARAGELRVSPALRTEFITFNVKASPFADARVRRALSLAIDRERLVRATQGRLAEPAGNMVRPGTGGFSGVASPRFDPVEAKRLLAEAGFPGGVGLPKIELTLNGNSGRVLTVGEVIQQMWVEHLGVRVELRPLEFKVYLSLGQSKAFQALVEGWGYSVDDPRDVLELSTRGGTNNTSGWSDAEFDAIFDRADATTSSAERERAFNAMEAILVREVPSTPLYFPNRGYLLHPTVHGWQDNLLGAIDWRDLWLEPAERRVPENAARAAAP